jgi:hypothetical protein
MGIPLGAQRCACAGKLVFASTQHGSFLPHVTGGVKRRVLLFAHYAVPPTAGQVPAK